MNAHVLVVDDELDIRDIMRVALEDEGYSVLEAADGIIALDILRTSAQPLVVLLDLMLPRMDGAEILQALAAAPDAHPHHAIIATTANYRFSQSLEHMLREYQIPTLLKPFEIGDFLDIVDQATQWLRDRKLDTPAVVPAPGLLSSLNREH